MTLHNHIPSVAPDGTRRVTGEAPARVDSKPLRFSAQKKTEIVLRLLRGEAVDLLSRACGVPASRIAAWRETVLEAGQESMKKRPAVERDRERSRLREKLGASTRDLALLNEQIARWESGRPVGPRRSSPCARPSRPPLVCAMAWLVPAGCGRSPARPSTGAARTLRSPGGAQGQKGPARTM